MQVGRSVDETLRLVQAFQYTDKHGEGKINNGYLREYILIYTIFCERVSLI